ncbi:MAG: sulfatase-like hydrolase/transferase, partial [Myxococcota bacterium]
MADPGAGGGSIQLGLAAAEGSTSCHREASNAEPGWSSCRLSIGAPAGDATLEIRLQGSSGKPWFVSSPLLIADRLPPRPPVFVIVLDTVRADRLVTFNRAIPLGDALDQLAQDGIAFERMRSSSSWTRTAVATLLTGLSADSHGVLGRLDVLEPRLLTLPEILQQQGYVTLAWSTNVNVLPLWGFDQGFDAFTDVGSEQWAGKKPDAREVFELVRRALESSTQAPGFHYVHLIDPHLPYLPEAGELERVRRDPRLADTMPGTSSQEGGERIVAEYPRHLAEILHVDQELGAFLEFLKERGLYRSSLILVAGDHGEEFLDHGFAYHGATLYEEVLRVPAVLKLPGDERAGTRVEGNAGLADLFPTMLSALDVSPPGSLEGRPLLGGDVPEDAVPGRPHFATLQNDGHDLHSVVDGRWKLIVDHDGDDRLFDLSEDPGEKHDLLADQSERAEAMRGLLEARIARRERGWHVRAVTRNPQSDKALALAKLGAELVQADMDDRPSLEAAFDGMRHVFSVQSWGISGIEGEMRQGKLVAEVAKSADVKHLVYGSAGAGEPHSGIPHFDNKLVVEAHMRALGIPFTAVRPVPFMELLSEKEFFPALGAWGAEPKIVGWDTPIPWVAVRDIGVSIANIFDNPEAWIGREVTLCSDIKSLGECRAIFTAVDGKKPFRLPLPLWLFNKMAGDEFVQMWRWLVDFVAEAGMEGLQEMADKSREA